MVLRAAAIGILPWLSSHCPLGSDFLEGFLKLEKINPLYGMQRRRPPRSYSK